MRGSLLLKAVTIGLLILILLIPLFLITALIQERASRRQEAVDSISSSWGSFQVLLGPVLAVPYKSYWKDKDGQEHCRLETAYFLPSELRIDGTLTPERRYRGIFEAAVYRSEVSFSGRFPHPDPGEGFSIPDENIIWKDAFLSVGITDTRGITSDLHLEWDGSKLPFKPTPGKSSFLKSGIHVPLAILETNKGEHSFSFRMSIQGTDSISVVPLGMKSETRLTSPWPDPSFEGAFLPETRSIDPSGFSATWKIAYFGRGYPQQWSTQDTNREMLEQQLWASKYGVKLFLPAGHYVQTTRSVKYAVLFVTLTFLAFALFEILASLRLHPLHYVLVGLALSLFYLLLLSLSEHIGFSWAYLLSAASVTVLIGGYCAAILALWHRAIVITGILAGLYGYLYVLLQLEDYALLLGSIALFAILAAVMYLTRRIDWYASSPARMPGPVPPPFPAAR